MESDLYSLLSSICPRVFTDIVKEETQRPYVTWTGIGGKTMRHLDNTAGSKRNTLTQINVWTDTRIEALNIMRQIEDALCASPAFIVVPQGEPLSMYEEDNDLYGCLQRFSIWADR